MRPLIRTVCIFVIAIGAVALNSVCLNAQTSKGTITGTVTDPSGAGVPGATVTARDTLGGETRTTTTGGYGEYRITAILPGIYEVKISAQGFSTVVIDHVGVGASVEKSLDVRLEVSGAAQTITVEDTGIGLQTETAELSSNISKTEIQQLPIASLNPISLVLTEPGAVRVSERDDFTNGASFSVDGLRPRSNNFLIDGFDNNDNGIAGQAIQPINPEAISEVVVQTNSYSSEFGRGGASLTNVIFASGTNQWHGAGFWHYDGGTFNAITPEQARNTIKGVPPRVPPFVENLPGFRIGGPLLKRKVFIFGSSQWDRLRGAEQGSQIIIPTAVGVATLQSLGTNQNIQILLNSLGGAVASQATNSIAIGTRTGCAAPCSVEVGTFSRSTGQIADEYQYVVRGDYVASDKDTISARWLGSHNSLTPDLFANRNALPGVDTEQSGPSRSIGLFWTHVISSRAVNELRFTGQTLNFGFDPTAATLKSPFANLPSLQVGGLDNVAFGGIATGFPQDRNHSVFQYQDAFSLTIGHHNLKMGVDISHLGITDGVPFNSRGTVTYNGGGDCTTLQLAKPCTALANYIDDFSGKGGSATKQFGVSQISYAQTQQAYYLQDEWKLRPNVTLNYGLRYEFQGVPFNVLPFPGVNVNTALTDPLTQRVTVQSDRDNFGPRLGAAYTPRFWRKLFGDDKTVFRAGFGIFYDVLFSNILANNAASTPNVTGGTVIATLTNTNLRGQPAFSTVVPSITPALSPRDSISTVASDLRNPETLQWNTNIERSLPGSWMVTIAYVGTRGEHLYLNHELNPGVNSVRLNPNRGGIFTRTNNGDSIYHGLQAKAEHSFRKGLLFRGAYTFSKSIDNGSEVFVTSGGSTRAQDQFSFRGDRGPSAFDRRQRLALTWVYDLPHAHGDSGAMRTLKYVTEGWQLSGTASFESGAPETIHLELFDVNGDLSSFNDRPSLGNPKVPINFSATCQDPNGTCNTGFGFSLDGTTFTDFFSSFGFDPNTGNFTAKASDFHYFIVPGKNGNIGRNTFYNPGRQDWAMSVQREFKIRERQAFLLRLEAFNPFNHPNLGGGEDGVPSVSGNILSTAFLNSSLTRVGGRSVRFFARYSF